jgi:hypothetical protein
MLGYFDKDFFRFLLGFIAIICTSIIILLASRLYEENKAIEDSQTASIIKIINN